MSCAACWGVAWQAAWLLEHHHQVWCRRWCQTARHGHHALSWFAFCWVVGQGFVAGADPASAASAELGCSVLCSMLGRWTYEHLWTYWCTGGVMLRLAM
jgi:hypothetical protein